jgi:ethanolamine utilization protein EutP
MAVEYCGPFINTPGEFLENRRFYPALITTAAECDIVLMLVNATHNTSLIPPQFASMFNRAVLGVVTCADAPRVDVERARRFLLSAGVRTVLVTDFESGRGVSALRAALR